MENWVNKEEEDTKPIFEITDNDSLSNYNNKKWLPEVLQDGSRKSAFQPYKNIGSVLTNLQRGNVPAETPIPQPTDINFHTRAGQGEITQQDIDSEQSVDICDSNGLTALHWASAYGQLPTVQLLLNNKAEVDRKGPKSETALLLAAEGGHIDIIRLLLKNGAAVNHVDDTGCSALMYAAAGNHAHSCNELFLYGADLNMTNFNNETAFSLAVDYKSHLAQSVIENFIVSLLEM
ncbi:ankyrin repeat family A protein 2 [Onthophagus taurus]|uniref:ankyrin repeat family A protein 2 n=1 Tax=Onthophagus taurus TaxID=166361 RepID=UPI0039BE1B40